MARDSCDDVGGSDGITSVGGPIPPAEVATGTSLVASSNASTADANVPGVDISADDTSSVDSWSVGGFCSSKLFPELSGGESTCGSVVVGSGSFGTGTGIVTGLCAGGGSGGGGTGGGIRQAAEGGGLASTKVFPV